MSFMGEIIKMYADPIVVGIGVNVTDLTKKTFSKEQSSGLKIPSSNFFTVPEDGDMKFLSWENNIPDILSFIQQMISSIEQQVPELSLTKLKEGTQPTSGYEISLMFAEFINKIEEMRGTYFPGIEQANKIALSIMNKMGKFNGSYEHNIVAEPILPADTMSIIYENERLNALGIKSRNTIANEMGIINPDQEMQQVAKENEMLGINQPSPQRNRSNENRLGNPSQGN